MQLSDIRNEVYAKGFGTTTFPASRINNFINDGYLMICRRVDYYIDEASYDFSTVSGTATYPPPANWARIRNLRDTTRERTIGPIGLRQLDNSGIPPLGPPQFYAMDGANIHLWPTPDAVYSLELRYWLLPSILVNDTDVPTLPADYHKLLWLYATWQCFESDDDSNTGGYWMNRFNNELAMFMADQKFPDSETPDVAQSMWDTNKGLPSTNNWTLWGWW